MQKSGSANPEVQLQAEKYVATGYQRLLTFESPSGGFNWWEGDDPGNGVLSALVLQMLTDTAQLPRAR